MPRSTLEAVTPTNLAGTVGTIVTPTPVVRALDQNGSPLPGVVVVFELYRNDAIANFEARTDAEGKASLDVWSLGTVAGVHTVRATSFGFSDVVFRAVAAAGPAAKILPVSGHTQVGEPGATIQPLTVRVVDSFGNPVDRAMVSFAVGDGGGTLGNRSAPPWAGDVTHTDSSGVAMSGPWTLGVEGPNTMTAVTQPGISALVTAYAMPRVPDGTLYALQSIDGRSVRVGSGFIVLQPNGVFYGMSESRRSAGRYSVAAGELSVSFQVEAGDWLEPGVVSARMQGDDLTLEVWVDGPDYFAKYRYRRTAS